MRSKFVVAFGLQIVLVLLCTPVFAQQAAIIGSVTDQTKAVLPGATVTATSLSTGGQTVGVSDARGDYRLANLPPGRYKVQAELSGFATVVVASLELLVGQNATLPFVLQLAQVNETVTVSAAASFVDTASSQVAGNINPRQMEALPLNGGNWLELVKNVKGISANTIGTNNPGVRNEDFQLNVDGQQVTTKIAAFQQGKLSRESIAEFQVVTNLFDITQGRSEGLQVNAISRSGTNRTQGSAYGFFRHDRLNAADALTGTVLPFENQQVGGSFGGPIVKDKLHYFGSSEYERQPGTIVARPSALPGQVYTTAAKSDSLSSLARVDYQPSSRDRLSGRVTRWGSHQDPRSTGHPSTGTGFDYHSTNALVTWARAGNTKVQELKVGIHNINWFQATSMPVTPNAFEYRFPGLTLGKPYASPQKADEIQPSVRYDLSLHRGTHDLKVGGEAVEILYNYLITTYREGAFTFTTLPPDIATRVPVDAPYDPSRWNLSGLESSVQSFLRYYDSAGFQFDRKHPTWGLWIGDTWRVSNQLSLNFGVRWDVIWDVQSVPSVKTNTILIDSGIGTAKTDIPEMGKGDYGYKRGPQNFRDIAPRGGFAWNVGGSNNLVIRGGSGLYFTQVIGDITNQQLKGSRVLANTFTYDGKPGFLEDPTRGIATYEQAAAAPPQPQTGTIVSPNFKVPYTWQSSLGIQQQLTSIIGFDVDLVHYNMYRDTLTIDPNLFYDSATGYNKDPGRFGRPNPAADRIVYYVSTGRQDYTALLTAVNRRLQHRVQGGLTHTWVLSNHNTNARSFGDPPANNQFDYLDGEYADAGTQRHTVRAWTAIDLPWGVSSSVQYSYGSGSWSSATIATAPYGKPGQNRLNLTLAGAPSRAITIPAAVLDRWDGPSVIESGMVIPRNALKGFSYQQVDVRLAKEVKLSGTLGLSLTAEVFNLFDRANYSAVATVLSPTNAATTARFGQPTSTNIPRQGQLGFRIAWK
jgi:hypothetical protein